MTGKNRVGIVVERHYQIFKAVTTGIRIAVVADTHGFFPQAIISSIQKHKVDIIAIVGDFVDSERTYSDEARQFLLACVNIAPTYMSLGNNDDVLSNNDLQEIQKDGVMILENDWDEWRSGIFIGGMTSAMVIRNRIYGKHSKKIIESDIAWLDEFEKLKGFKILLDHHPENYDLYTKQKSIDLILSGHIHGGQISLFGHGLFQPNHRLFPKYAGGVFDNRLVVSRGLSNTLIIPRLFNPTEMVYVDVR